MTSAARAGLIAAGAALLVAGCGQKGPLYLPDKSARVVTTPASPAPAAQPAPEPAPTPTPAAPAKSDQDDDSQAPKK